MQIFETVKTVSFNNIAYPRLKVVGSSYITYGLVPAAGFFI